VNALREKCSGNVGHHKFFLSRIIRCILKESYPMKKAIATLTLSAAVLTGVATFSGPATAASRRPRPPAVDCTNAQAHMQQLFVEGRALDTQLKSIRAQQAANTTGNFSVINQTLADQLFAQETAVSNAANANSQAKGDLSRACGIPFLF
jgi:hypothetical protein